MLACMEETKRTFMTGSEGMPILAKSQVRKKIEKLKKEKKNENENEKYNWKTLKNIFFFSF